MSVNDLHTSSDAFRHGALGKNGYRVLRAISELGQASEAQLRSALPGMHRSTVRRHLLRFQWLGLAEVDDSGRWKALPADLNAVARRLGVAGKGEQQRAAHAAQREVYLRQPWVRSRRP